jgi:AcrR family transcriptional regulator
MAAPRKLSDDRLLDTAARLFAERGYDATSITHLVDELGVTRMTLYARARSKEKLAAAVYERAIRWYGENLPGHVRPADPPSARLRGLVRLQLEAAEQLRDSMTFVNRQLGGLKPRAKWRAWWRELDRQLSEIVAEGQATGDLIRGIDPLVTRRAFWAIVNDLPRWYRPGRLSADAIADQIAALFGARG